MKLNFENQTVLIIHISKGIKCYQNISLYKPWDRKKAKLPIRVSVNEKEISLTSSVYN